MTARRSLDTQPNGGAERDRTDDLMLAKHALSQLSYSPNPQAPPPVRPTRRRRFGTSPFRSTCDRAARDHFEMVGPGRFELPTSGVRSNQLSYGPVPVRSRGGVEDPRLRRARIAGRSGDLPVREAPVRRSEWPCPSSGQGYHPRKRNAGGDKTAPRPLAKNPKVPAVLVGADRSD